MFNDRDELVAITASKITDADNMGFGIPVTALRELLEQIGDLVQVYITCNVTVVTSLFPMKRNIARHAGISCHRMFSRNVH